MGATVHQNLRLPDQNTRLSRHTCAFLYSYEMNTKEDQKIKEPSCEGRKNKRRRVQQTLDSFVKRPSPKTPKNRQPQSFLAGLPDDLLRNKLLVFLHVQDMTTLSSSCHLMAMRVDQYRGPLPYIIRQELLPKRIIFYPLSDKNSVETYQSQSFRFLIKTKRHKVVQVKISLNNHLWNEQYKPYLTNFGRLSSFYYSWDVAFSERTDIEVTIAQMTKFKDGSYLRSKLFSLDSWNESYELNTVNNDLRSMLYPNEDSNFYDEWAEDWGQIFKLSSAKHIEEDLRDSLQYYWMCAMRAIQMAPKICPNINYFMLWKDEMDVPLLRCFPPEYLADKTKRQEDRELIARYRHRSPGSIQEWCSFMNKLSNDTPNEFDIHEVPWYRDWYPKPTHINEKNVLASLPSRIFVKSLLPHLSFGDLQALSAACPALSARLIERLRER